MNKNKGLWLYHTDFINRLYNENYISEGLIRTYPTDYTVNSLRHTFNFASSQREYNRNVHNGLASVETSNNNTEVIIVLIELNENDKYNKQIVKSFMKARGWFDTSESINDSLYGIDMWCINFEKRFDDRYTEVPDRLYYITRKRNVVSIQHQGFVPKTSTWKLFDNESRVYFFTKKPSGAYLESLLNDFDRYKRSHKVDDTYVLFTINTSSITDKAFYKDPRLPDSVFTLEGVSPTAIENIEDIDYTHN